jgi:putative peptidoglycan lipid II flippase
VTLWPVLGFRGVALGTSLAAMVNFAVLGLAWRRRHGGLGGTGVVPQLARVALASVALAVTAWAAERALAPLLPRHGFTRQLALGLGPVAAGGIAYLLAARALGVAELGELGAALRRRRSRIAR